MDNTSPVSIEVSADEPQGRTSPVYVQEKGKLALNDILSEKPADFNGQIDISWLQNALNQKAAEIKYAPWDALYMPAGLWAASAYGNNTIIAAAADGKICISSDYGAVWHEKQISDNLCAAAFGNGTFILMNNSGKCFVSSDNGLSWQESIIANDNITCAAYFNDKFIAGSSSGSIYVSEDNGLNWEILYQQNNGQIIKIIYSSSKILMVLCDNNKSLYSLDNGNTFKEISMPEASWSSITHGKGKFIACAYNGERKICCCLDNDILSGYPVWNNINISYNEPWKDICYGADVFTLASSTGITLASNDGLRWIKTPCPEGSWNNILRTDYFFMIFSISENNDNLNAVRSSNGGLAGIMFATLNEIISDENTDKAINPQTLKDYLAYRTGKNNSQYPVYGDNLLIECTSTDTRQIKITNINAANQINSYNQINTAGIYIIEKSLQNAPITGNGFLLVQQNSNIIYQFFSLDNLFNTGYMRTYTNNTWGSWKKTLIQQNQIESMDLSDNNISVSENTTYNSSSNIIAEVNGVIKKFNKNDLNESINNSINNAAGNHLYYQNTRNYKLGTLVLGSDNALYYCIAANGTSNIKNPVSSPSYWLKIINSNGKINADNLSKTLGSFALLNNIALTNSAVTGILPENKGGTNTQDGFGWKNAYSDTEFNAKVGLSYPFTTQQLVDAIMKLKQPLFCMVHGWRKGQSFITDFPSSDLSHRTIINYYDANQFYIETIDPFNLTTYICNVSGGKAGAWVQIRKSDGSIPVNVGGTGLTHGALGKPTNADKLAPNQTNNTNCKIGDIIYRYSYGSNPVNQYVPSGGSWLLETFVFDKGAGTCCINLGGVYIVSGDSKLDTNNQFDFIHILTKIA
ncbi:MAG TPA: hypothetical protein H9804_00770 [Candidatus Mucispirillum faecigallinarum]|uniref:Photosynthesis system II assembly factor Ycf48/Hcf136-like domain-containing protein n=1 Tax=Candidatus Mucispirillum faecigallinarum TaxID=2838699 RepID=A0A9D2GT03_9BACT|nr:hypothetical protein [Candidatus Mucispirillum faecigallinarum]